MAEMAQPLVGFCLLLCVALCSGTSVGVSYDSRENTLSPRKLVELLKKHDIFHVSLSDTNPTLLEALSGTGIEVSVGMSYKQVKDIGKSKSRAISWVKKNVMRFMPSTFITSIIVGNEAISEEAVSSLVPTMKAIHSALVTVNLDKHTKVSSAVPYFLIRDASTEPRALFMKDLRLVLHPLLDFVSETGSFLVLNTNFDSNSAGKQDFFHFVVDAAINAMTFLHYPDIPIVINDLGLPSAARNTFFVTKDLMAKILTQDMNSPKISVVLVKMSSLEISMQKELNREAEEQFPSASRELLDKKPTSTKNETSEMATSLLGNDTTPTTMPITTPTTTPITTPTTTPITTPTTPITTPTTPITTPTTPVTTPTTPVTTPTTPITTPTTPTTTSGQSWCVAKPGVPDSSLQVALDYACGLGGADCGPIQQSGSCYSPDTMQAHASYAFDSYYKKNGMAPGSCDFGGNAVVTTQDPSVGTCVFPTSGGSSSVLNTSIPTSGGTIGLGPGSSSTSDAASIFLCLPIFFTLVSLVLSLMVGGRI